MKFKKRIAAMGAAMVMAVSMMSIEASAYDESFHLNKNVPSFSKNVTVVSITQRTKLEEFKRVGSTTASVTLYNNMSSALSNTWTAPRTNSADVLSSALGTRTTIGAYLNNYSSAISVIADGEFSG